MNTTPRSLASFSKWSTDDAGGGGAGFVATVRYPRHAGGQARALSPLPSGDQNRPVPLSGDPPVNSSGRDIGRRRARARPADAGGASARETRTQGKPHNPAAPSGGSAPLAAAALLVSAGRARDRPMPGVPRQSVFQVGRMEPDDAAHNC